jgi:hypothetical protein
VQDSEHTSKGGETRRGPSDKNAEGTSMRVSKQGTVNTAYFRVSARKYDSCLSSMPLAGLVTSTNAPYPYFVLQYLVGVEDMGTGHVSRKHSLGDPVGERPQHMTQHRVTFEKPSSKYTLI